MTRTKQIKKDKTKIIPKEIEYLNDEKSILYEKGLERTNTDKFGNVVYPKGCGIDASEQ